MCTCLLPEGTLGQSLNMVRDGSTSLEPEQGGFQESKSHVDPYEYLVTSRLIRHQLRSALPRAASIDYARESLS